MRQIASNASMRQMRQTRQMRQEAVCDGLVVFARALGFQISL